MILYKAENFHLSDANGIYQVYIWSSSALVFQLYNPHITSVLQMEDCC